jgi:hypothetical protein
MMSVPNVLSEDGDSLGIGLRLELVPILRLECPRDLKKGGYTLAFAKRGGVRRNW